MLSQLVDYIHAAFSGLWITTCEPEEAEREISALARDQNWQLAVWARGLRNDLPEDKADRPIQSAGD
jgi:hypothetical protein